MHSAHLPTRKEILTFTSQFVKALFNCLNENSAC